MDYRSSAAHEGCKHKPGNNSEADSSFEQAAVDVVYSGEPNNSEKKKNAYSGLQLMVASILAAIITFLLLIIPSDFAVVISQDSLKSIDYMSAFAASASLLALVLMYFQYRGTAASIRTHSPSFVDLDERASSRRFELQILELKHRLHTLNSKESDLSVEHLEPVSTDAKQDAPRLSPVESYIHGVTKSLDRHIELSEKKASKLLDTGTMYLRRGIYFYVGSIFVWQIIAHVWGVDKQLIFGVVSCSLTFLVVEFLAAWFLKQYRSFIDSSIQFMKVKSVFDRYLLSYYAVKEFSGERAEDLAETKAQILKVLAEEIKWPEALNSKSSDMNHMVQMFDSLGGLLEKMKKTPSKNEGGA